MWKWAPPCCETCSLTMQTGPDSNLAHLRPTVCSSGWGSAPRHWAPRSDGPWPAALSPSHLQTGPEGEISRCHFYLTHLIEVKTYFQGANNVCRKSIPDLQNKSFACRRFSPWSCLPVPAAPWLWQLPATSQGRRVFWPHRNELLRRLRMLRRAPVRSYRFAQPVLLL